MTQQHESVWQKLTGRFTRGRPRTKDTSRAAAFRAESGKAGTPTRTIQTVAVKPAKRPVTAHRSTAVTSKPVAVPPPRTSAPTDAPGEQPKPRMAKRHPTAQSTSTRTPQPIRPADRGKSISNGAGMEFDRENEQYDLAEAALLERLDTLRRQHDEYRNGTISLADSIDDIRRLSEEIKYVSEKVEALRVRRAQYLKHREMLTNWGPTDGWVVAGSVVTVSYGDQPDLDTFVLTEREFDSEYETLPYDSTLGLALRRKRPGESTTYRLPDGRSCDVTVVRVLPGFRAVATGRKQRNR